MNTTAQRRYRFILPEHWAAGLAVQTDGDQLASAGIAPFLSYSATPQHYPSDGAFAPAMARDGQICWRDAHGRPHRLEVDDESAAALPAPAGSNHIRSIAVWRDNLWMSGGMPAELRCYDLQQMARRFVVPLPGLQLIDLTANGDDGVWALATAIDTNQHWCLQIDCAGYERGRFVLDGMADPVQLTWLARAGLLAVLAHGGRRLLCYRPGQTEAAVAVAIDTVRAGFEVSALGSDSRSRLLLAGADHGVATVLVLDAEGTLLYALPLPTPATGVHAGPNSLLVTTAAGLLRCALDNAGGAVETSCTFITPMLESPITGSPRRWLRAEVLATLPAGTSMIVSHLPMADQSTQKAARAIIGNSMLTATQRRTALSKLSGWQPPVVFRGNRNAPDGTLAVPLFDVHAQWLLVSVTLVAAPDAALPQLHRLDVLYPGLTLMEYLPRIYQRAESEPGNFLRALVGVLETGTQEQDQRIAAMGRMISPHTAPAAWLDYVARWLDLPWDDALEEPQKRALLASGNQLAAQRGTRAGLETLLQALIPGASPRFRVTDIGIQYGFARLGTTQLPAVLPGLPASTLSLNRKAVLGKGRLPSADATADDLSRLVGWIAVSVTATAAERITWQPWLQRLLGEMLPVTARLRLHWRSVAGRQLDHRLGDDYVLDQPVTPHLNTDAVTGLSRLGAGPGLQL